MLLLYLVLICVLTILVCILLWRVGLPRSTLTNLINIPGYNVLDMIVVVAKVAVSAVTFVTISIAQLWMSDYVAYLYFWRIAYYIASSYHPPKSNYIASEFCTELNKAINQINLTATSSDAVIIVAGDFNQLNTSFLETDHGLVQIVNSVTHWNNVLDRVYTNRLDMYSAHVLKSLINSRPNTMAVIVAGADAMMHFTHRRKQFSICSTQVVNIIDCTHISITMHKKALIFPLLTSVMWPPHAHSAQRIIHKISAWKTESIFFLDNPWSLSILRR